MGDNAYTHLERLQRRAEWLATRIEQRRSRDLETSHDDTELAALKWAIQTIYDWVELPKLNDEEFSQRN